MQLPKLTPLQSRLLASAVATCMLVVVWITFQPHHFVYAAELPLAPEDSDHSQLGQAIPPDNEALGLKRDAQDNGGLGYTGDFAYFDRNLLGRQTEGVDTLKNKEKKDMETDPGTTKFFMLEKSQLKLRDATPLELRSTENAPEGVAEDLEQDVIDGDGNPIKKRQAGSQVFISVNTCKQPVPDTPIMIDDPPQLKLYISTSTNNQKPGPNSMNDLATQPIPLVNGSAQFRLQTDSDVYIGVEAPKLTQGWEGSFSFEVAASTDQYYHSYERSDPFLYMVDIDSESGLFITHNLTTDPNNTDDVGAWLKVDDIPFTVFAFPDTIWGAKGLEASFCGLKNAWDTNSSNITIDRTMTDRFSFNPGKGGNWQLPKAQIHVQSLERNTTYIGMLVMDGGVSTEGLNLSTNLTVGRGGRVWQPFQFTSKAEDSCQVIFDLEFCSDVAYAVPSSPKFKLNTTDLARLYDDQAKSYYKNFSNSLAQIACDTTDTAQYSLARNCEDCARDYKEWLCAVLMPRCEDFTAPASNTWLRERNINAQFLDGSVPYANNLSKEFNETMRDRFAFSKSRNLMIDEEIQPGPYKEMLPCEDLCFDIVRSCPAQLQFACPNEPARSLMYGRRDPRAPDVLKCNFPGAVVNLNTIRNTASGLVARLGTAVLVAVLIGAVLYI